MGVIAVLIRRLHDAGVDIDGIISAVEEAEGCIPAAKTRAKSGDAPNPRGTRLPPEWVLTRRLATIGMDTGLTEPEVRVEGEKFRDFWAAKTGANATKLDWDATWRNWCRSAVERRPSRGRGAAVALPVEAGRDDWEKRVEVWRKMGGDQRGWHPTWGPMPGDPGCMVPRDLLMQSAG